MNTANSMSEERHIPGPPSELADIEPLERTVPEEACEDFEA